MTTEGNRIPLDPQPTEHGRIILVNRDAKEGMVVRVLKKNDPAFAPSLFGEQEAVHDGLRWVSHFVTCDNPDAHRRKR